MLILLFPMLAITMTQASDQIPAPKQDHPIVLIGGTIHTVSGAVIEGGQILFDKGQIVAVGARVDAPANAEKIDVTGKHVYPAFIAAESVLGLQEILRYRSSADVEETGAINPNVRTDRAYNPESEHIPVVRSNGIGIAHVVPEGGLLAGTSAAMMLDAWTWEDALLKDEVGVWLIWPDMEVVDNHRQGKTREEQEEEIQKQLERLNEIFDDAEAYYQSKTGGNTNLKSDLRWESLEAVVTKRIPLFIRAEHAKQIISAVNWVSRRNYRMVLVGGTDAWLVPDILKEHGIPVMAGTPNAVPTRRWEAYDARYALPLKLYEAGISFCLTPKGGNSEDADVLRNLPFEAGAAVAFGLPREEAVKAITLNVARILGIDHRVGSLDPGKDATLLVVEGDPLEITSRLERLYIQGRQVDLSNKHTALYEKYRERYRQMGILPR
ncbi:MAG: amidohydrolase family protein [Fidelibacterota bacterium]|nr:MAG: amidohydrolase family protein [Candidatus Neomarinimicrobiota bacterium]